MNNSSENKVFSSPVLLNPASNRVSLKRDRNLRQHAYFEIRKAIIRGHYPPHMRLIERELCESLNVSRSVIREALRYLEMEKLVTARTRYGQRVTCPTIEEIWQIDQLIWVILRFSVHEMVHNYTPHLHHELEQLLEKSTQNPGYHYKLSYQYFRMIFIALNQSISWNLLDGLCARVAWFHYACLDRVENREKGWVLAHFKEFTTGLTQQNHTKCVAIIDSLANRAHQELQILIENDFAELFDRGSQSSATPTKLTRLPWWRMMTPANSSSNKVELTMATE